MTPLSPKRRSELRAEAHKLDPVVIIGDKGLSDEVVAEIDRSLRAHELIKVRAASGERESRGAWLEAICARLEAHPVQQIGKVFVIYRENPQEKEPKKVEKPRSPGVARRSLPSNAVVGGGKDKRASGDDKRVKGSARQRFRTPSPRPESAPRRRRPRTSR